MRSHSLNLVAAAGVYIRRLRYAVQHTTPPSLTPNTFYLLNEYAIKLRRWRRSARDAMYGRRHCSGVSRAKIISRSFSFRCQPLGGSRGPLLRNDWKRFVLRQPRDTCTICTILYAPSAPQLYIRDLKPFWLFGGRSLRTGRFRPVRCTYIFYETRPAPQILNAPLN